MLGFEPRIADIGSERTTECATITAHNPIRYSCHALGHFLIVLNHDSDYLSDLSVFD